MKLHKAIAGAWEIKYLGTCPIDIMPRACVKPLVLAPTYLTSYQAPNFVTPSHPVKLNLNYASCKYLHPYEDGSRLLERKLVLSRSGGCMAKILTILGEAAVALQQALKTGRAAAC